MISLDATSTAENFPMKIGETWKRQALHRKVGGGEQFGMTSCRKGTEFLIFHDPKKGKKYGYDLWEGEQADGSFSYTGQGRTGDQKINRNNKALLTASFKNNPIHFLLSKAGSATYLGRVMLGHPSYRWENALDQNKKERKVIVFNLIPLQDFNLHSTTSNKWTVATQVKEWVAPPTSPANPPETLNPTTTIEREEFGLQAQFGNWLLSAGRIPKIIEFQFGGKKGFLRPDFFLEDSMQVIEAKPTTAREYVRLAIGQVLDYRNLAQIANINVAAAILLPATPSADLMALIESLKISIFVPDQILGFREIGD